MSPTVILLLVEDSIEIRALVQDALEEAGFQLETASNGREALAALEKAETEFRGLVTDVNLGDGPDGWEVAKHARELNPTIPVVYMSGGSGHEWASHGVPNSTLVAKPFAPAQIVTAISALMNATDVGH